MRKIEVLPEVPYDLADAVNWYDRTGDRSLGERFIETFEASHYGISSHGEIDRIVYLNYRRIILRPFPYKLFYRIEGNVCVIALVIHEARNPENIHRLLDDRDSRI